MAGVNPNPGAHQGAYGAAAAPARKAEPQPQRFFPETPVTAKHVGYGLPCAHCKTYYSAELPACPICKCPQRVGAVAPVPQVTPAEQLPDPDDLARERDRFLHEFNAQVVASPLPPDAPAPGLHCNLVENHSNEPASASVCQECFDRLQERVDVLEAALHIDVKEAAQIVYDAVWADPSDPNKTYQNAAQALLTEVRRRSGVVQVFGTLQPPVN